MCAVDGSVEHGVGAPPQPQPVLLGRLHKVPEDQLPLHAWREERASETKDEEQ